MLVLVALVEKSSYVSGVKTFPSLSIAGDGTTVAIFDFNEAIDNFCCFLRRLTVTGVAARCR